MKRILEYTYIGALLLATVGLGGCSDDDKTVPLAEPVPLTMSLNSTSFVQGETMKITFTVAGTTEGKKAMNEDLSIRLSASTENGNVDHLLFDNFPTVALLEKGETSKTFSVPIKSEGINQEYSVELTAFARGYKMAGATQSIVVGDYYYVTVGLKDNSDNSVKEGQVFTLEASLDAPVTEDLIITVTPKDGEEVNYENLPSTLTIPAGERSVESDDITISHNVTNTENEVLTLNLTSSSNSYPLTSKKISITKVDIDGGLGTEVGDERWLYEDPDLMFVSEENEALVKTEWKKKNYKVMRPGDLHPNSGKLLPEGKWKFFRAYEFHKIKACLEESKQSNDKIYTSTVFPKGFADQNTAAVESAGAVDNAKYTWVTDEGYLRMITLEEDAASARDGKEFKFGTSALYTAKFFANNSESVNWGTANIRIYPGMRIETRARIRGAENSGVLPGIWLQGNKQVSSDAEWNIWPDFGEIDVMENNTKGAHKKTIEQTFHLGYQAEEKRELNWNPTTSGVSGVSGAIGEFQIYWMEWIDNTTVAMGVNGKETLRITASQAAQVGAKWPFTDEVNDDGLYYILTMMFLKKQDYTSMKMSYKTAKRTLDAGIDVQIPRMEIDWVRFYVDDSYSDHGKAWRKDIILY